MQSRQEVKQLSVGLATGIPFTLAGAIFQLDTIGQGDDINQRSGDITSMKHLRYQLTSFEPTVNASSTWRLIVFTDSMGNGAAPAVNEVLDVAVFASPYQPFNYQRRRFKILHDRTHTMVGGNANQEVTDIVDIPLNYRRYYNSTLSTSSNIGKNTLYALVITSNSTTSVFAHEWAIRYTDS
jgi:hypothetical protein